MSKQKIYCHQHLENQVPNAHIQNILSLPVIAGTNPGITADLVRIDSDCHNWNFGKFVEQLRQWAERNPISFEKKPPEYQQRKRVCHVRQSDSELNNCVYCNKGDLKSTNCNSVTSANEDEKS